MELSEPTEAYKYLLASTVDTIDLSKPWGNNDTSIWSQISKNGSSAASTPPTLNDGTMFSDNSSLYLFGGTKSNAFNGAMSGAPHAPAVLNPNGLWQYDLSKDQWSKASPTGDEVADVFIGMTAQGSGSEAYYLGGAMHPTDDSNPKGYLVEGLISFDESATKFTNSSTTGLNDDGTIANGFMSFIEPVGDKGILVTFGGFSNVAGEHMSLQAGDLNEPLLHRLLGNVSVYDISKQNWYHQQATGDVPSWRFVGCSVIVSAPDQTSHNIYVFGGWGGSSAASDGNVYVLSIPSFRWIRVTRDNDQRTRHTCGLMGNHTMLVVGGGPPNNDDISPQGVVGCDSSSKFAQGLGIFSLNNHTWSTRYDPSEGAAAYKVHPSIFKVIGGNEHGGATLGIPQGGFTQQDLGTLLGVSKNSTSTNSTSFTSASTSTSRSTSLSGGAIAGIVIGVILLVAIIGALIFFFMRRRRQQRRLALRDPAVPVIHPGQQKYYSELDAVDAPVEKPGGANDEIMAGKYAAHEMMFTEEKPHEMGMSEKPLPEKPKPVVAYEMDVGH